MIKISLVKKQNLQTDLYLIFNNCEHKIIFACERNFLLAYFEYQSDFNNEKQFIIGLAYLFAPILTKFFSLKIANKLFILEEIKFDKCYLEELKELDLEIDSFLTAKLYSDINTVNLVENLILEKDIISSLNKVTGLASLTKQVKIDIFYQLILLDTLRILKQRMLLLKCVYLIEEQVISFYFEEKIVQYFCKLVLSNNFDKSINFNIITGKLFAELFRNYLSQISHKFIKTNTVELCYFKDKELLEFNLQASKVQKYSQKFEFFTDLQDKLFIHKLMMNMNFIPNIYNGTIPKEAKFNIPFPVEIGVTYLLEEELKKLKEGDIIIFDKTCVSNNEAAVDNCVINFEDIKLTASLHNDNCKITNFITDW